MEILYTNILDQLICTISFNATTSNKCVTIKYIKLHHGNQKMCQLHSNHNTLSMKFSLIA